MHPLRHARIFEVECARSPGWFEGECDFCDWSTSGSEPVVEDAAYEHITEHHPRRLANA